MKRQVFEALGRVTALDALLATNTSSIPVSEIAAVVDGPDRVLGMHFFNPVPTMRLVELVKTMVTSVGVLEQAVAFVERIGKRSVVVNDRAGFLVDYLLVPYLLDAIRMLESGYAIRDNIDAAMMLGAGYPMGPLALCDFVGLDIIVYESDILFREFKDPRFAVPSLLRNLVRLGKTGRKAGSGFYEYVGEPDSASRLSDMQEQRDGG